MESKDTIQLMRFKLKWQFLHAHVHTIIFLKTTVAHIFSVFRLINLLTQSESSGSLDGTPIIFIYLLSDIHILYHP